MSWDALASTRVTATGIARGRAAGTTTALAIARGSVPHDADVEVLWDWLVADGAWLRNE